MLSRGPREEEAMEIRTRSAVLAAVICTLVAAPLAAQTQAGGEKLRVLVD